MCTEQSNILYTLALKGHDMTLKGHVESLTSGQGHDLTRKGHVASVDPYRRPEHSYGAYRVSLHGL